MFTIILKYYFDIFQFSKYSKLTKMTSHQKRQYNYDNELDYHFAPFTEQRKELRKEWNGTRKCWDLFLFEAEKKYQQSKTA